MAAPSAARLISAWNPAGRAPPHRRLAALLAVAQGGEPGADDTLGERNRRLLRLHRALVGTPLEARVTCAHCGADSELVVPADAILAAPGPDPDARVRIQSGGRTLGFRLPRMADIEAASHAATASEVRRAVLERCRVDGDGASIPEDVADRLGAEFEALDPAANVVVNIACSGCQRPIAASADLASFIARDLDRLVDGLLREVDVIASAYGWDEPTILALPAERRRRYLGMIAARGPARAGVSGRAT